MQYTLKFTAEQINVLIAGLTEIKLGVSRPVYDELIRQVQDQERERAAQQPQELAQAA